MKGFCLRFCIFWIFIFSGMGWYGVCNTFGKNEMLGQHDVLATNQRFQNDRIFDYRKLK